MSLKLAEEYVCCNCRVSMGDEMPDPAPICDCGEGVHWIPASEDQCSCCGNEDE